MGKNKRSNSRGDKWGKMDLHLEESRTPVVRREGRRVRRAWLVVCGGVG